MPQTFSPGRHDGLDVVAPLALGLLPAFSVTVGTAEVLVFLSVREGIFLLGASTHLLAIGWWSGRVMILFSSATSFSLGTELGPGCGEDRGFLMPMDGCTPDVAIVA